MNTFKHHLIQELAVQIDWMKLEKKLKPLSMSFIKSNSFLNVVKKSGKTYDEIEGMISSIGEYTGSTYEDINKFLRGDESGLSDYEKSNIPRVTKNLDYVIKSTIIPPTILWRVEGFAYGKQHNTPVEKYLNVNKREYITQSYFSTTFNKKNFIDEMKRLQGRVGLKILCPKKFHGIIIDEIEEKEVLLPRKSKFLINNQKTTEGYKTITLTLISQKL